MTAVLQIIPKLPSFIAESSLLYAVYAIIDFWDTICWNYFRSWDHFQSNLGNRTVLKNQNHCCLDCLEPLLFLTIICTVPALARSSFNSESALETSLILWNAGWLYTSVAHPLMMTHFISAGLSLLELHYSYFHWLENRIYTKVNFIKK